MIDEKAVAIRTFVIHNPFVPASTARDYLNALSEDTVMPAPKEDNAKRRNRIVLLLTDAEFAKVEKRQAEYGPETSLTYVIREFLKKGAPDIFASTEKK